MVNPLYGISKPVDMAGGDPFAGPLPSVLELEDPAPIPFRRPALRSRRETLHQFPFFGELVPAFLARIRFRVERLGNRCRPAHIAEILNFHLEIAAFGSDL